MDIENICDDVLIEILSLCKINEINIVCKKWRDLAYNQASKNTEINIELSRRKSKRDKFQKFIQSLKNYKGRFGDILLTHYGQLYNLHLLTISVKNFRANTLTINTDIYFNSDITKRFEEIGMNLFEKVIILNSNITLDTDMTFSNHLELINSSIDIKPKTIIQGLTTITINNKYKQNIEQNIADIVKRVSIIPSLKYINIYSRTDQSWFINYYSWQLQRQGIIIQAIKY